jgi:hypothetical protein
MNIKQYRGLLEVDIALIQFLRCIYCVGISYVMLYCVTPL